MKDLPLWCSLAAHSVINSLCSDLSIDRLKRTAMRAPPCFYTMNRPQSGFRVALPEEVSGRGCGGVVHISGSAVNPSSPGAPVAVSGTTWRREWLYSNRRNSELFTQRISKGGVVGEWKRK